MGPLYEFLKIVFALLFPPLEGLSAREKSWRLSVAGGLVFMAGALSAHIALACGLTPFFAGFASASDVSDMKLAAQAARADGLRAQIVLAVKDQCHAKDQKNAAAENFATSRKYQLLDELHHIGDGKEPVDIPACWEIPTE